MSLCPHPRSQDFIGFTIAFCAVMGIGGSLIAGVVVDKTKRFKETLLACFSGFVVCVVGLNYVRLRAAATVHGMLAVDASPEGQYSLGDGRRHRTVRPHGTHGLLLRPGRLEPSRLHHSTASQIFPIGIEIGIETTFPVQEATSSGLLVTFAYLISVFLTINSPFQPGPHDGHRLSALCL